MIPKNFAIVVSEFNQSITDRLLEGAQNQLLASGIPSENMTVIRVPGAVEIPLAAQLLAKSRHYAAILCLGCVIRGETSHYDYVCQQVSYGCQKVMLQFDLPVIFGVLTTDNFIQAEDRIGGRHGHKGKEAADAALKMLSVVEEIKNKG